MSVTKSRNSNDLKRYVDVLKQQRFRKQVQLLTLRRMHQLGIETYEEFSRFSGISFGLFRQVMSSPRQISESFAQNWLQALQLDADDFEEIISWDSTIRAKDDHLADPGILLKSAIQKHEAADFSKDPLSAQYLYYDAAAEFSNIISMIQDTNNEYLRLILAEALYRLSRLEKNFDLTDRAYWHAQKAAFLAQSVDGDLALLAMKEVALACFQLGRKSLWTEGLLVTRNINDKSLRQALPLGLRFPEQDQGLWMRLTYRDAINVLVRRRHRDEARDMLAGLRAAMEYGEGPLDEFLLKTAEAQLNIREGRPENALKTLTQVYQKGLPEIGGPPHYLTLLSTMAEAQVMYDSRHGNEDNYLLKALQYAHLSGLKHTENKLLKRFSLRETLITELY
ncbi:MAG: hypothetical protein H6673_15540 [Anaerolineales bacterium]|nr:hypothetical protein [Anaerolineales bacterium]